MVTELDDYRPSTLARMEHRLGKRHLVDVPAELRCRAHHHCRMRVCNVATDGMYVETNNSKLTLRLNDAVQLLIKTDSTLQSNVFVSGVVCHVTRNGAGIMLSRPLDNLVDNLVRDVHHVAVA